MAPTHRPVAIAIALLFALLAALLSALLPLGESADEVSHHSYVRYVAENGGLPPVRPGTTVLGESFQPPLYYALAAPLTAWLPRGSEANLGFSNPVENNPDWELGNPARARLLLQPAAARWPWRGEALGWHLARFLSIALGLITLFATYRLARLTLPDEPWTALLAMALVAFLPSFAGLSAVVTNDALATTLGALLLWQLARLVTEESSGTRGWALAGLLGALAVWTKASGWLFVGTIVIAVALLFRGKGAAGAAAGGRALGAAGGAWLVGVLPLWWLNLGRSGDLLGRGIQAQVTEARQLFGWAEWLGLVSGLYRTWWAGFGGAVHLHFPDWLNALLLLPLLLALWGLRRRHRARRRAPEATRRLIPLLAAHCGLVLAAWLLWSSLVMGSGQGRLLFPALPAVGVLVASGACAGGEKRERTAVAWGAGALALSLAALLGIVVPTYRTSPPAVPRPAAAALEQWQVGELPLALVAFHLPWTIDDRIRPGDEAPFYVEWEAGGKLPDLRLRLRWVDRAGNGVGVAKEGSPIARHPLTDEWVPGRYAAYHRAALPEGIEPGWYRLMLSVLDAGSGSPLPLHGPGGAVGPELMVGQTTVVAP